MVLHGALCSARSWPVPWRSSRNRANPARGVFAGGQGTGAEFRKAEPDCSGVSDADSTEGEIRVSGPGKLSDLVSEGGGARSSSSEGGVVDSPGGGR